MINVLEYFKPESHLEPGIDSSAFIEPGAAVSEDSYIGPNCVICKNTEIKAGAVLRANVYVGNGSYVGKGSRIEPGVVIYNDCSIGDECVLHSGSVIGAEGFGFIPDGEGEPRKIPQIGGVRIGNKVEIGACTTIDRGTIGNTVIGNGVKIDNHVQVGHNVKVGNNCIIVAQTGLAGSSILEDNVIMAAKSGTSDHVRVGKGSTVAALGGVIKDISPGSVVSGFPARDHRKNFRIAALMQKLPSLFDRVKKLEKESVPSRENDNDK